MKTAEQWANDIHSQIVIQDNMDMHIEFIRKIQADAIAEAHRIVMDDNIIYPGMELSVLRRSLMNI